MNIFIYSDESGVFDKIHNNFFVFGGLVFLSKDERDICARKYTKAERVIRCANNMADCDEVKATTVSIADKGKLYRSLNNEEKFAVIINQKQVLNRIFNGKKDKQRYLDYAYRIGVKRKLQDLIAQGKVNPAEVEHIYFYVDEHTTATNGQYELREGLEQEFKNGMYSSNFKMYYPPIFPALKNVQLEFCNSSSKTLVRGADIVANKVYYYATHLCDIPQNQNNLFISRLP